MFRLINRQESVRPLICLVVSTVSMIGLSLDVNGQVRLPGFGPKKGQTKIVGFGQYAEVSPHVVEADRHKAKDWMKRYDRNRNGVLESSETVTWSNRRYDLDGDGRMLLQELTVAIAQIRLQKERATLEQARRNNMALMLQAAAKKAAEKKPSAPSNRSVDPVLLSRQSMCNGLAGELIAQHDRNGNKQLELSEFQNCGSRFGDFSGGADVNGDNKITRSELAAWLLRRLPPSASERLAKPLRLLDVNRDGQISMSEFANPPSIEKSADFHALDQDNDGLISPKESYTAPVPEGSIGFANNDAAVIKAKGKVTSSIWIDSDITIDDLDVRVAITKQNDDQMKLFLIGPDGQQVTLFAGGWQPWSGFLFESTLIDDEAPLIETKLSQPPYPRKLRTDALKTKEPSLKHFYGNSVRGSWRLVVVNMNDKFGVLHHWSLWVTPRNK